MCMRNMCICKRLPQLLGCRWSLGAGDLLMHPPPRDTSGRETQGAWRHTGQSPGAGRGPLHEPQRAVKVRPRRPVEWRQGAGRGSSHTPRLRVAGRAAGKAAPQGTGFSSAAPAPARGSKLSPSPGNSPASGGLSHVGQ